MNLKDKIRAIENHPINGVTFRDITTLLKEPSAFQEAIDQMVATIDDLEIDKVIGVEARGFIIGAPIALALKRGFVPVRKPGKLPHEKLRESYDLEYGKDSVEIHRDGIEPGEKVLVVDDLLATGGTAAAVAKMVNRLGGEVVAYSFLIELDGLGGRDVLGDYRVESIVTYKEG